MDAKIAAAVPLSSPAAAQRCAEGAGLDSGAAAAAQSAMPSIAPLPQTTFPTGDAARCGAPAPLPNLHQLDGRDQVGTRLKRNVMALLGRQREIFKMGLAVVAYISVRSCACSFPQRDHRAREGVLRVTLNRFGALPDWSFAPVSVNGWRYSAARCRRPQAGSLYRRAPCRAGIRDDGKALLPHSPRHASRQAQSTALTSTTTSLRIPKTRTCREPKKSGFGSFRQI